MIDAGMNIECRIAANRHAYTFIFREHHLLKKLAFFTNAPILIKYVNIVGNFIKLSAPIDYFIILLTPYFLNWK